MDDLHLTLRAALAADRLEDFVKQEEAHGVELEIGSDFERALGLLLVQRGLSQERHQGLRTQIGLQKEKARLPCRASLNTLSSPVNMRATKSGTQ